MTISKRDEKIISFLTEELIERMKLGNNTVYGKRFIISCNENIIRMLKTKMEENKF